MVPRSLLHSVVIGCRVPRVASHRICTHSRCPPSATSAVRWLSSMSAPSSAAPAPPSVVFVTGNANKLIEVQAILADVIPDLQSISIDVPELQGADALTITRAKAIYARQQSPYPILVEDTSLCFNALSSLPGPYIKWFLDKLGHTGLVSLLAAYDDKSAYAQCTFAYVNRPTDEPVLFDGRCAGRIVDARCGTGAAFGWDPIFEPQDGQGGAGDGGDGRLLTFAEMDKEVKNRISHRAKALELVKQYFAQHPHLVRPQPQPQQQQQPQS